MTGHHTDDPLILIDQPLFGKSPYPGNRGRRGGLNTDPLLPRKVALHAKDLIIGHGRRRPASRADGDERFLSVHRRADPYRSRNGLWFWFGDQLIEVLLDRLNHRL